MKDKQNMQKVDLFTLVPSVKLLLGRIALVVVGLLVIGFFAGPETVFGQADEVRRGIGATGGTAAPGQAESQINTLITNIINIFSWVVGIISVIMIIVGGLKYILSGGDSNSVSSAKNTILYAVVGLVIVAFAQIIVLFVLDRATA